LGEQEGLAVGNLGNSRESAENLRSKLTPSPRILAPL